MDLNLLIISHSIQIMMFHILEQQAAMTDPRGFRLKPSHTLRPPRQCQARADVTTEGGWRT